MPSTNASPARKRKRTTAPPLLVAIARSCFTTDSDLDGLVGDIEAASTIAARLTAQPLRSNDLENMVGVAGYYLWTRHQSYREGMKSLKEAVSSSTLNRTNDEDAAGDIAVELVWPTERGAFMFGLAVAFHLLNGKSGGVR